LKTQPCSGVIGKVESLRITGAALHLRVNRNGCYRDGILLGMSATGTKMQNGARNKDEEL